MMRRSLIIVILMILGAVLVACAAPARSLEPHEPTLNPATTSSPEPTTYAWEEEATEPYYDVEEVTEPEYYEEYVEEPTVPLQTEPPTTPMVATQPTPEPTTPYEEEVVAYEYAFVITLSSGIFHTIDCTHRPTNPANLRYFATRAEAYAASGMIDVGRACRVCNP